MKKTRLDWLIAFFLIIGVSLIEGKSDGGSILESILGTTLKELEKSLVDSQNLEESNATKKLNDTRALSEAFEANVSKNKESAPQATSSLSKAYNPLKLGELFIVPLTSAVADNHYNSYGPDGRDLFLPENGIRRGINHWLSDGNAIKKDVVYFTGILAEPRTVSGIVINWASSPGEVRIDISRDGITFEQAVDWTTNRLSSKEFEQKLYFKEKPIRIRRVRIGMRNPVHNFFGINFTGLLVVGAPVVQLTSGITSMTEEFCWQIENGDIYTKGAELVLGSCIEAVASGDSREIFEFNSKGQLFNPLSKLCVQLKDNIVGGEALVLDDCRKASDGSGLFELMPNNQLRLARGGNLCLTSPGDKPGVANVALNSAASSTSVVRSSVDNGPEMAVDGKDTSFWLSEPFVLGQDSLDVDFMIDIGSITKIKDVFIEWKYPAVDFTIDISENGKEYQTQVSVSNNGLTSTSYSLEGKKARYVKIHMTAPSKDETGRYSYGIKQVRIFSNTMRSAVGDCNTVKQHNDGRDKVFPLPYNGDSFAPGLLLKAHGNSVKARLNELQELSGKVTSILPNLDACRKTSDGRDNTLKVQATKLGFLSEKLEKLTSSYNLEYKFAKPALGGSELYPAEDCVAIKNDKTQEAISGFYYVRPFCSTKPLRVYCDMNTGNTIYPMEMSVHSSRAASSACATVGLKPLLLRDKKESVMGIRKMLSMMNINDNRRIIPLTHDFGCDNNKSCNSQFTQIGSGVEAFTEAAPAQSKALNSTSQEQPELVLCSTNTNLKHESNAISLGCDSRFSDIKAFKTSPLLTSILVKCPTSCSPENGGVVIGSDVYRDDSSICLAAMHANTLNRSTGLVQITPIEGLESYGTSRRNGISSVTYTGKRWTKSFVTSKYNGLCPSDSSLSMLLSFVEMENRGNENVNVTSNYTMPQAKSLGMGLAVDTFEAINRMERYMDTIGGITYSPAMKESIGGSQVLVSKVRSQLKPTQIMDYHTRTSADDMLVRLHTVSSVLYYHMEEILETIVEQEDLLNKVRELKSTQSGFDSFKMPINDFIQYGKIFESWDTPGLVNGVGNWRILYEPIGGGGRSGVLGQTSSVGSNLPDRTVAIGSFSRIKYKKFYDIDYHVDVYVDSYEGSIGLTFRMQNFERYYLLEFNQNKNGGFKRLIRVMDGQKSILSTKYDGGYVTGSWHHVRILLTGSRIQIWVGTESNSVQYENKDYSHPVKVFDLYDGTLLSGSVGFYSSGIKGGGVYFDNINIEAKPCTKPTIISSLLRPSAPPTAPVCSSYKSGSFGGVHNEFMFIDPELSNDGPSNWEFRSNVGGLQTRSLIQTSNIHSISSDNIGTHAILGGNRQCNSGVFEYSFFPQCPSGIIGGIIHYKSESNYVIFEMGSYFSRIRAIKDGVIKTIASNVFVGYQVGVWNNIEIQFGTLGTKILASTNNYGKTQLLYSGSPFGIRDGSVGLSSFRCAGVAFQTIQLKPLSTMKSISGLFVEKNSSSPTERETKTPTTQVTTTDKEKTTTTTATSSNTAEMTCKAAHTTLRKKDCETLSGGKQCEANYCSYCCENSADRTSKEQIKCKNECHKNDFTDEQSKKVLAKLGDCHSYEAVKLYSDKCNVVGEKGKFSIDLLNEEWTNQFVCFVDMCQMCCNTQPMDGVTKDSRADEASLSECYLQCILQDYKTVSFSKRDKSSIN
ncbi:CpCCP2 [Cryptosporidium canis]|uniref:CpCCP2 n=1 Tax=Cryptosporidium canis TaxID=195482 RepID=A0A9D5DHP7_9CRYT|nr:CpCCP2 [Cryptosporidium canis]